MQDYEIQCCYKGTDGRLRLVAQAFEAATPDEALEKAQKVFQAVYPYATEMIFSSPKISNKTTIVQQGGKYNVNVGNVGSTSPERNIHIGDTYH